MQEHMDNNKKPLEVRCNQCGRNISSQRDVLQEDVLHIEKNWGYFSEKDGVKHRWILCERCYDKLIQGFAIPIEESDITELL